MFNIPPHFLRDLERATFSNIEQQAIEFVVYTLRPWLVRWEQRLAVDLIPGEDRTIYYPHFSVEGLLRGDIQSRNQAYQIAKQNGWMNADEIRELEDMNPLPDGKGQEYWKPVNIGTVGEEPPDETGIAPPFRLGESKSNGEVNDVVLRAQ